MTDARGQQRTVSICMSDFEQDPTSIISNIGAANLAIIKRGDARGKHNVHRKNFAAVWMPFYATESWEESVGQLIENIGGTLGLKIIVEKINPKSVWLQIRVPLFGSPYVESGFLSAKTIGDIASSGLGLDVLVFDFKVEEPTHHPRLPLT